MKKLVWGMVMTVDYYGEWEAIVVKAFDLPKNVNEKEIGGLGAGWIHEASEAGKLKHVKAVFSHNGMQVQVRWPDGDTTLEKLVIVDGNGSARIDMNGGADEFDTRHLCVQTTYNGIKVNVPLIGRKVGVLL